MKKQATLFQEDEAAVLPELSLQEAEKIAAQLKTALSTHCLKLEVAGSIRRQRATVHDIDFVAISKTDKDWQQITDTLKRMKAKLSCQGSSLVKAYLPYQNGLFQVDFYRAKPSTFGIHLLIRTGSEEHNMWLAAYAISKGMRLKYSEGLTQNGKAVAGENEQSVFEALGLPYPLPSQREIVDNKPAWMSPS
ncbi:hypothetical protein G4O51_09450 [Candidatus Bathyarchaeota archaeon A05DMB-2]|jgi:DNA polymerase/3'-5' exonuclease PolX|nr:hypothetical protein [Candidatus Bathyarchaeota archaeon A05DMB-2]